MDSRKQMDSKCEYCLPWIIIRLKSSLTEIKLSYHRPVPSWLSIFRHPSWRTWTRILTFQKISKSSWPTCDFRNKKDVSSVRRHNQFVSESSSVSVRYIVCLAKNKFCLPLKREGAMFAERVAPNTQYTISWIPLKAWSIV